jgi:hypothetical protein
MPTFPRINLPEFNGRTYEELHDLYNRLFLQNENDYRIWSEKMKHKIQIIEKKDKEIKKYRMIIIVLFAVILFLKYGIYFVS